MSEVYNSVDQLALSALLTKKAVDRALTTNLDEARKAVLYKTNEILAVYKSIYGASMQPGAVIVPPNLNLLPALVLALMKNVNTS
jgi:protein transport protein SEC24